MSDNENLNPINHTQGKRIDESSIPSINKIKSMYENKITTDQNENNLKKKKPTIVRKSSFSSQGSIKKSESKDYEKLGRKENNDESKEQDKNIKGSNVYNQEMNNKGENHINRKQYLKRKYEDIEEPSEKSEKYDNSEEISHLEYYNNSEIIGEEVSDSNEKYYISEENNDKSEIDYSLEHPYESTENEVDVSIENTTEDVTSDNENNIDWSEMNKEKLNSKKEYGLSNSNKSNGNPSKRVKTGIDSEQTILAKTNSSLPVEESIKNETNTNTHELSSQQSSSSKYKSFFNSNTNSSSVKRTLSVSSSSSKDSDEMDVESNHTNESKGIFGFKRFSRKNSKTEDSSSKTDGSSKFKSFFHRSSKKRKEDTSETPTLLDSVDKINSSGTTPTNTVPVAGESKPTVSEPEPISESDTVKRVPKRKRESSSDDENGGDAELEKQKVKKIRLIKEEIKSIQQSIELKQQELLLQYDNLLRTRNSLSDPTAEPLPDIIPPSSSSTLNFNNSKGGRPSSASTFSNRPSYYDHPFEIPSFPGGDMDFQNTSLASSDFRRFSNPRFSNASRMNMEDNGRYSMNSMYNSFNNIPEEPSSFYTNYSTNDGNSRFNPNRPSNINSNPRFSSTSFNNNLNSSYYSKFEPNLNSQNQPKKSNFFSFFRRRKSPTPHDSFYHSSSTMMPSPTSFDPNFSSSDYSKRNSFLSPTMDVFLSKPFYYYFIPLTRRKVKVRVDPLLRNAINYARAAGNYDCLKYLCEFEKIPNKYVDLRSIEEAAAHNDIDELKFLLKHSWFYDIKRYFIFLFKMIILITIFGLILYFFNGFNETLIALFVTYIIICITYNWIYRDK